MTENTLWIRKLSCGHERNTGVACMCGQYKKPEVGSSCFCRECNNNVKVISVKKADKKTQREFDELIIDMTESGIL